jgi:hypothetical protein
MVLTRLGKPRWKIVQSDATSASAAQGWLSRPWLAETTLAGEAPPSRFVCLNLSRRRESREQAEGAAERISQFIK